MLCLKPFDPLYLISSCVLLDLLFLDLAYVLFMILYICELCKMVVSYRSCFYKRILFVTTGLRAVWCPPRWQRPAVRWQETQPWVKTMLLPACITYLTNMSNLLVCKQYIYILFIWISLCMPNINLTFFLLCLKFHGYSLLMMTSTSSLVAPWTEPCPSWRCPHLLPPWKSFWKGTGVLSQTLPGLWVMTSLCRRH